MIENKLNKIGIETINYKNYEEAYLFDEKSDKYFTCIDTMEDYYKDNNLEMPRYAYGCSFEPVKLDTYDILEQATEEHAEDMMNMVDGVTELKEAIEKFNEVNKNNGSYFMDCNTIIELF